MYNPSNMYQCQKEQEEKRQIDSKKLPPHRRRDDRIMLAIGMVASFSSLPQIIKIFQTKTVVGISLTTQLFALASVVAWFIYGVHIKNKPLAITTFITIIILTTSSSSNFYF